MENNEELPETESFEEVTETEGIEELDDDALDEVSGGAYSKDQLISRFNAMIKNKVCPKCRTLNALKLTNVDVKNQLGIVTCLKCRIRIIYRSSGTIKDIIK